MILDKQKVMAEVNNDFSVSAETIESVLKTQLKSPINWIKQIAYVLYELIMIAGNIFLATILVILVMAVIALLFAPIEQLEMLTLGEIQQQVQTYFNKICIVYVIWSMFTFRKKFKRNFFKEALYVQLEKMRDKVHENM